MWDVENGVETTWIGHKMFWMVFHMDLHKYKFWNTTKIALIALEIDKFV